MAVSIRLQHTLKHLRVVLKNDALLQATNDLPETSSAAALEHDVIMQQLLSTVHERQRDTRAWGAELLYPCPLAGDLVFVCNCGEECPADLACCPVCGAATTVERPAPDTWELERDSLALGQVGTRQVAGLDD